MILIRTPAKMLLAQARIKRRSKKIGFVPTMGCLHEGHISLVRACQRENDITVASIFVNPAQFGPKEDYKRYPRDLKRDARLLSAAGCDILFYPDAKDIYPEGYSTFVGVKGLSEKMCGASRPGHFRGVCTVCAKLFNVVRPDTAYFGQKDFQQSVIIRKMAEDLGLSLKIRVMPVVREDNGLAMSSRNRYLSSAQKDDAAVLYASLKMAQKLSRRERSCANIISAMRRMINNKKNIKIDYIQAVDPDTLEEKKRMTGKTVIALAAWAGKARLIDNIIIQN